MDQVIQQNAQLVQQAARSANELESEAARLREAVERFRVSEGAVPPATHTPLPSATPRPSKAVASTASVDEWEAF